MTDDLFLWGIPGKLKKILNNLNSIIEVPTGLSRFQFHVVSTINVPLPPGATHVKVQISGGGGGGGGGSGGQSAGGGGNGGYASAIIPIGVGELILPTDTLDLTIGAGGGGGVFDTNGTTGQSTSFAISGGLTLLSVTGGSGGITTGLGGFGGAGGFETILLPLVSLSYRGESGGAGDLLIGGMGGDGSPLANFITIIESFNFFSPTPGGQLLVNAANGSPFTGKGGGGSGGSSASGAGGSGFIILEF